MASYCRCCTLVLTLGLLGWAASAEAGPRLYSGTLTVHGFGSTRSYGGPTSPYTVKSYYALPIGRYCNTVHPSGMGKPLSPCLTSPTFHVGAPLLGAGVLYTATLPSATSLAPPAIGLGSGNVGDLRRLARGSFAYAPPYLLSVTMATLINGSGALLPGGGPGDLTFYSTIGGIKASVRITAGAHQFGGTLRVLGRMGSFGIQANPGGSISIGSFNWLWSVIGGPVANTASTNNAGYNTAKATFPTRFTRATGFPWTTGAVTVSGMANATIATPLMRSGYDNRTPGGLGTLQLVSPKLTRWDATLGGGSRSVSASIAILKLQVPEPSGWLGLGAGAVLLGALRASRMRRAAAQTPAAR